MQQFLDFVTQHKILCGSEDLASFLTGQDHEFEQRKADTIVHINNDELNKALSSVLIDGSHAFEEITSDKTYMDKTVKAVK
jgi:hypothetical protein